MKISRPPLRGRLGPLAFSRDFNSMSKSSVKLQILHVGA